MEYLDYIKSLSCGDPTQQIPSISRIIWLIKEQPTFILINTIAITMAVEFTQVSNKVRFFIAEFFRQCSSEMCLIRNREDFFRHLTSVLDTNNPVAQQLMLKILGYLAPLLTDMLEVHHKVLLALEGGHRLIRETAFSILPSLITYCPSISSHIFEKAIPEHYLVKICSVLPDQQEIIKKAYAYILRNFGENRDLLFVLSCRSRSLATLTKAIFFRHEELERVENLCEKYGIGILNEDEKPCLLAYQKRVQEDGVKNNLEVLQQKTLEESDYKNIYKNWKKNDQFSWIISRIGKNSEQEFAFKTLYKLKVPSSYLEGIKGNSLGLALCLIRGGWHGSMYDRIFELNKWEQYLCSCEMMCQGLHSEAFTVLTHIKQLMNSESENIYHWICGLMHVCSFESQKTGPLDAFRYLGSTELGEKIYFQLEYFLCRYLLVTNLNHLLSGKIIIEEFLTIRQKFEKLLYLFENPSKDLMSSVKFWRDVSGLLAMCLSNLSENQTISPLIKKFYSYFSVSINEQIKTPQHLARVVLEYKVKYPKQFFRFASPTFLNLQINCNSPIKLNRGIEFILEVAVNLKRPPRNTPRILVSLTQLPSGDEGCYAQRQSMVNAAGVCNITITIVLNTPGIFNFRIVATLLNEYGREIGKPEYSVITFECI